MPSTNGTWTSSFEARHWLVGTNENLERLMNGSLGFAIFVLFALAFSIQTVAKGEKSEAQQDFEDDPSNLAIDSGRWSVLFDRSNSGLDLLEQPTTDGPHDHAYWLLRADAALKGSAIDLLQLRNRLLYMELVKPSDLNSKSWPAWIFEPPTSKQSPDVLSARLAWLENEAAELVEIGCEIGREKSSDTLFCSVE